MEKLIKEKCSSYGFKLFEILLISLVSVLIIPILIYIINTDMQDIINILQKPITKSTENIILTVVFVSLLLVVLIPIYLSKKMYKAISISYKDISIPMVNPQKTFFSLINDNSIFFEDSVKLKIENFPDKNIDILNSINSSSSIVVRQYKLNAPSNILSKINMKNDIEYNFILSVMF